MTYLSSFLARARLHQTEHGELSTKHVEPTQRVMDLANLITQWHATRAVPERWQSVQLGRIAAQFGATRETTAAALIYAGWKEVRQGATSVWNAPVTNPRKPT